MCAQTPGCKETVTHLCSHTYHPPSKALCEGFRCQETGFPSVFYVRLMDYFNAVYDFKLVGMVQNEDADCDGSGRECGTHWI